MWEIFSLASWVLKMKAVFDVGKVLGNAQFGWREILATSGESYQDHPLANGQISDFDAYLKYETGEISTDSYLDSLQEVFCLTSKEAAFRVHASILLEEFDGVQEVIQRLHTQGIETATLSNNNPIHWQLFTSSGKYPSVELIQQKLVSYQLGFMKPDPRIFSEFCKVTGWVPSEIVFVDDSPKNIETAIACGWRAKRIDPSEPVAEQLIRAFSLE